MKKAVYLLVLLLFIVGFCGTADNGQLRVAENLRHENILLPPSVPDKRQLALIDFSVVADDDGDIGILLSYDDLRTKREVDYLELYDVLGDLLAVGWIDRFGICRVAMDRGLLLDEGDPDVERILVQVPAGTLV